MREIIQQWVPGGCYTPQEQISLSLEVVRTAARLLEFSGLSELETALESMNKPLVTLAGAGVLAQIAFEMRDPSGVFGAVASLDPYDVEEFEAVDLSRLQLLANTEGRGRIEIVYRDMQVAQAMVDEGWLASLATDVLEVREGSLSMGGREDTDEYNDQTYHEFG
jgi:hypothetical protein